MLLLDSTNVSCVVQVFNAEMRMSVQAARRVVGRKMRVLFPKECNFC